MQRFLFSALALFLLLLATAAGARTETDTFAGFPFNLPEEQSALTAQKLGLKVKEPWGLVEDTNLHVYEGKLFGVKAQLIRADYL